MSYATMFIEYLRQTQKTDFTHRDILLETGTNCPYSVLVDVKELLYKLGYKLTEKMVNSNTGKRPYKRFYIEGI